MQSIANQTLQRAASPAEFTAQFQGRLQALSRAHTPLTRSSWEGAQVADLLREQLAIDGEGDRISCEGPPAFLDAQSSLALALVLHELGTNARKYGALSVPEGRLLFTWTVLSGNTGWQLQMDWTERGGPRVHVPTKTGFGTALIGHSLRGVGGQTSLQFHPEGLSCRIQIPLGSGPIQ